MTKPKRPSNHRDAETRLRTRQEHLGSTTASCLICNERSPLCLELHHVAGKAYDDETRILCCNHHAKISDAQKDHPPKLAGCLSPLEKFGHLVLGLADLLRVAVEEWGAHNLCALLSYVAGQLKTIGLSLINMADGNAAGIVGATS